MLYEGDTAFGHYQVADTMYMGRPARVLYSGNNDAAQSGVARDGKEALLFDYNQRFLEMIRGIKPANMLLLGGGACTLPTAIIAEFPNMDIDVVELDEGLIDIARKYFDFRPSNHVRLHIGDGRRFLECTELGYDMIVIDVFTHATIPDAFQTCEFAQSVRHSLNKNGVAAMNIIASLQGVRSNVIRRIYEVMQAAFPQVEIFPANRDLSPWISQNYILVAQQGLHDTASYLTYSSVELPKGFSSASYEPRG